MKNRLIFNILIMFLFMIVSFASVLATTNIGVKPVTTNVTYNDQFLISVNISSNDSIAGATLDINFDPSVLKALSQVEGGFLSQDNDTILDFGNNIDNIAGKVTFSMLILTPQKGVNGSGSLVNITFKAIKKNGNSDITIDNIILPDWNGTQVYPSTINNGTVNVVTTENVLINEFLPDPATGNDWVELYNNNSKSINLTGWTINDSTGHDKPVPEIILTPGMLYVVDVVNILNMQNDGVILINDEGLVIDEYVYNFNPGNNVSVGRLHDGFAEWINFTSPTPNAYNNRLPTGNVSNQTIDEDGFGSFNVTDYISDPDNDPLTFTIVDENVNEVDCNIINETNVTLTPTENWNGVANCTITVNDTYGTIDKLFYIIVNSINDPTEINESLFPNPIIFDEDSYYSINLSEYISDIDNKNNEINWSSSSPLNLTVDINNDTKILNISADQDWSGQRNVTFTAIDGDLTDSINVTIIVNPINDAPVIIGLMPNITIDEERYNDTVNLNNYFNDVDSTLTYTAETLDTGINTIIYNDEMLNVSGVLNFYGNVDINITASDEEYSVSQIITITVTPVNDGPVITSTPGLNATEAIEYSYDVDATDVDSVNLSYSLNTKPTGMTINSSTGLIKWIPNSSHIGLNGAIVNVTDSENAYALQSFNINVGPALDIVDIEVNNVSVDDNGTIKNIKPGDTINVNFAVKNRFTNKDLVGITAKGEIKELSLTRNTSSFNLYKNSEKPISYTFAVPYVISLDSFVLNLSTNGYDLDIPANNYLARKIINFNINKTPHEIKITNKEFSRDNLACYKDTILKINLTNTGKTSENIKLNVYSQDLGYNQTITDSIIENTTKEFLFNINATNATPGTKTFPFIVSYQYDYYIITDTIDLLISDCFNAASLESALTVEEDTTPAQINLTHYTNGDTTGIIYLIENETNISLIDCSINGQLFNCSKPAANASGVSRINMSITAGSTVNYGIFNVNVTPVNDPPYLINNLPDVTFNEDSYNNTIDLSNYFNDIEDSLVYTHVSNESNVIVRYIGSLLNITATADWHGTAKIIFNASDGKESITDEILVSVKHLFDDIPYITDYYPKYNPKIVEDTGTEQRFNITVADPDEFNPTIKWYLNDVESGSGNSYSFIANGTTGDYTVKANMTNSTNFKVWNLTTSDVPLTTKYIGTITTLNSSQLDNATNITIEETNYGGIYFKDILNLTKVVDIDNYVLIGHGKIGIDTTKYPQLNKSAHIVMKGLSFETEPVIYYNEGFSVSGNTVCPAELCYNIEWDGSILEFDVAHFSTYFLTTNNKPVANAGSDQLIRADDVVTLDGSASYDPDNDPITYHWTQVSGPAVSLSSATAQKPTFTPTDDGTYMFQLVVNDGTINSLPDNVIVTVYGSVLSIKKVSLNSEDKDEELKPGEDLIVKVKVENKGDVDIEDIELKIWFEDKDGNKLEDDDGDEIEDEEDFDLDEDESETVTFEFTNMPMDVEDGDKYKVHVEVEGENADNNSITYLDIDESETIEFVREKHELELKAVLTPNSIKCSRRVTVDINIRNLGEKEEDVTLTVSSSELGINKEETFELSEDLDDDDSKKYISYNFVIGDDVSAGLYPIKVKAEYSKSETETLNLEVNDCMVVEEKEKVLVKKEEKKKEVTAKKEEVKEPITISFRDTSTYLALLATTFILMTGLVILFTGAAIISFRKK